MDFALCLVLLGASYVPFPSNAAHADSNPEKVEAKLGSSITLGCRMDTGNKVCTWNHGGATFYTNPKRIIDPGYRFVEDPEKGVCNLKIDSVKLKDNGGWVCSIAGNEVDNTVNLVVIQRPTEYYVEYKGQHVVQDKIKAVVPESGIVKVACDAKRSLPKAKITWEGEDIDETDYEEVLMDNPRKDGPFDTRSVLTLRMQDDEEKQKKVTCLISYSKNQPPIKISLTFAEAHDTEKVTLAIREGANSNEFVLSCQADGIPEPKLHILMTSPRIETTADHEGRTRTVKESGSFACLVKRLDGQIIRSAEEHVTIKTTENNISSVNDDDDVIKTLIIVSVVAAFLIVGFCCGLYCYRKFCKEH